MSLRQEEKRSPEDLILAMECPGPKMTCIISAYNSLARSSQAIPSNHRRARKCQRAMGPGARKEMQNSTNDCKAYKVLELLNRATHLRREREGRRSQRKGMERGEEQRKGGKDAGL